MTPYVARRAPHAGSRLIPTLAGVPAAMVTAQYVATHALPGAGRGWILGSLSFGFLAAITRGLVGFLSRNPRGPPLRALTWTWLAYDAFLAVALTTQAFLLIVVQGAALDPASVLTALYVPFAALGPHALLVPLLATTIYATYQTGTRSFTSASLTAAAVALTAGTAPLWLFLAANAISLTSPIHFFAFEGLVELGRTTATILAIAALLGSATVAWDLVLSLRRAPLPRWTT